MKTIARLCLTAALVAASPLSADPFRRGDASGDGIIDLSDPVRTLAALFLGAPALDCLAAGDSNDDGRLNISDVTFTLAYLYVGGKAPAAPFPACGDDPAGDAPACAFYQPCIVCLDPTALNEALRDQVPPVFCVPADAQTVDVGLATVTACPSAKAVACGDPPAPGCGITITKVEGTIDVPGRKVLVHIECTATDFPILAETVFGATNCLAQIGFAGDVTIPFTAEAAPKGYLRITDVLDPTVGNITLDLTASGGAICSLLASQKDLILQNMMPTLESALSDMVATERTALIGSYLCP